ncbi:MAG TPA: hypothetical protein VG870_00345 [Chitinophagaceae bacterium]|nr:hypothetical protein [Chitinophagaceae bacterium]
MLIGKHTMVTLHFVMKDASGEILEDTRQSGPAVYVQGTGQMLPVLEASVTGLQQGDTTCVRLEDSRLGGVFHFEVTVAGVRKATEEEIRSGRPAGLAVKKDCGADGCC